MCRRAINHVMKEIERGEERNTQHTESSRYINIYTSENGSSSFQNLTKVAEIRNGTIFVDLAS
jgi:hypothetical protein